MIQKYLRAAYASIVLSTSCSMWDFSDCGITDIPYCVMNGRSERQDERLHTKGFMIYQMKDHLWNSRTQEYFGCGDGDFPAEAQHEAWRDAHREFELYHRSSELRKESRILEETLKLCDEQKYVACAQIIPADQVLPSE